MKLFVPGRICLFGEHSDWAGGYRRMNAEIEKGYTVICGTDQRAFEMTRACQMEDTFVLPVVSPAVPEGLARLRATVLAAHEPDEIAYAIGVIARAGKEIGIIQ